jgi:hypothetical protein
MSTLWKGRAPWLPAPWETWDDHGAEIEDALADELDRAEGLIGLGRPHCDFRRCIVNTLIGLEATPHLSRRRLPPGARARRRGRPRSQLYPVFLFGLAVG